LHTLTEAAKDRRSPPTPCQWLELYDSKVQFELDYEGDIDQTLLVVCFDGACFVFGCFMLSVCVLV